MAFLQLFYQSLVRKWTRLKGFRFSIHFEALVANKAEPSIRPTVVRKKRGETRDDFFVSQD